MRCQNLVGKKARIRKDSDLTQTSNYYGICHAIEKLRDRQKIGIIESMHIYNDIYDDANNEETEGCQYIEGVTIFDYDIHFDDLEIIEEPEEVSCITNNTLFDPKQIFKEKVKHASKHQ